MCQAPLYHTGLTLSLPEPLPPHAWARAHLPQAPSNLSPPLQVCFLVKRSRGTLAMPPARRLWPEAPRRSRFRFFLPF